MKILAHISVYIVFDFESQSLIRNQENQEITLLKSKYYMHLRKIEKKIELGS